MARSLISKTPTGRVVWYVMGRLYTDAGGRSFDAGYFAYIAGIDGPFFSDTTAQGEATALFTFYADKFEDAVLSNGDVSMSLSPPGKWRMYLTQSPAGDFADPASFSAGKHIATWHRTGTAGGVGIGSDSMTVLSFELTETYPFEHAGAHYDLAELFPSGVTQICYGSSQLQTALPDYPEVRCFAGSAMRVG